MHPWFSDLEDEKYFINDIRIFSLGSYGEHLHQLQQVLRMLEKNGFAANPFKCEWAVTSTKYFGFLLTPTGTKHLQHK